MVTSREGLIQRNLLCQTAIHPGTGANADGRLLSQMAVTIDGSTVDEPSMQ